MKSAFAILPMVAAVLISGFAYAGGKDDGVNLFPTPQADQLAVHGNKTIGGDGTGSDSTSQIDAGLDAGPSMEHYETYDDDLCSHPSWGFVETFERPAGSDDPWKLTDSGCEPYGVLSPGVQPGRPILTPDHILEAVRRIGLPASAVEVPVETLVHYDTTVYTRPVTFARTVTLLGYTVEVRAEPSSYLWIYGDGETARTAGPGNPYPADDITHAWLDAHRTFHPRVDTTYTVRHQVDDGPWLSLGDTVTVPGPEAAVRIREATPMLAEMN